MTRPDKHAARFGDRYQPPLDWRRLHKAVDAGLPLIKRMTEAFWQVADNMRQAHEMVATARQVQAIINGPGERWTYLPHVANSAAPTLAELEAATTPLRGISAVSFGTHSGGDAYDVELGYLSEDGIPPARSTYDFRPFHPGGYRPDILGRIDDTLMSCDAQRSTGEPWPFRGF